MLYRSRLRAICQSKRTCSLQQRTGSCMNSSPQKPSLWKFILHDNSLLLGSALSAKRLEFGLVGLKLRDMEERRMRAELDR
eukprot:6469196-Amphidinium_carterae.1